VYAANESARAASAAAIAWSHVKSMAEKSIQIHGGFGFTWDADAGMARVITNGPSRKARNAAAGGSVVLCQVDGRRWLALVAAGVVVAAWIQRARLSTGHPTHARVNFAFDVHMDSIALGAILALVLAGWPVVSRQLRAVAELLGIVAAVAVFAVIRQPWQTMKLTTYDLGGYGQVALLCLFVVAVAVIAPTGGFARALSLRPLVHVGKLSYGIYLWNQLLALICLHMTGHLPARTGAGLLVWALVLLAVAQLSYRFVENPLRTRWGQRRGRSLATVAG